ncbi:hypothetical protein C2G38_2208790 [Gigaspora rosea]|uniref:Uncharacterized protein n=1 Tax=Gigaspora rosea TaxID=44941 RepID=A0A397UQ08_9GLOM|nr:hypothetical protein C2G38_2208790 [Gigaspora rosea]
MQYHNAKPKTDILKKLRNKYSITNSCFYKIWRKEKVHMVEWHQSISDLIIPLDRHLSIPKSHLPNINQAHITENSNKQSSVFSVHQINKDNLHLDSIVASDKWIKNRKSRPKSVRISDLPNIVTVRFFRDESMIHKPTKKVEELSDLYILIEQNRKKPNAKQKEF